MAAYERLQKLGEERFRTIINLLQRGEPAMGVARMIQTEWKEFQDVSEKTLTQQLNRLGRQAKEETFGKTISKELVESKKPPNPERLIKINVDVFNELCILAQKQKDRIQRLMDKEASMPVPVVGVVNAVSSSVNDYSKLLQDLQKMRFDLGFDTYMGVVTGPKGSITNAVLPDGTRIQHQVYEAVTTVEEIFQKRNVPTIEGQ